MNKNQNLLQMTVLTAILFFAHLSKLQLEEYLFQKLIFKKNDNKISFLQQKMTKYK